MTDDTSGEAQRARTEAELRASEEKYRSLFTSIDEGFSILELVYDADGNPYDFLYVETNPAFLRHTGFPGPVDGKTYRELAGVPPDAHWLTLVTDVVRSGQPRRMEGLTEALGRWYQTSLSPIGGRESQRCSIVFTDISERKRAEQLMQAALEREQVARALAEEATALRDEFISVISHELRTPLSPIVIWASALRAGKVAPERVERALDAILHSAKLQHSLIDDLLDMSRLSAGKLKLTVRDEDLRSIVEEALITLRPTAAARKLELTASFGSATVRGLVDRGRLQQVLWNVVGNALKFTPEGGHVTVSLSCTPNAAIIEVRDDGIGIAPSFLPRLFDRFRQADMSQTRSVGGLGLGLSIVRQLVEMHGGVVTAHSEGLERGSTFRIELPLGAAGVDWERDEARESTPSFVPWPALSGQRILLVEDESHTRAVLTWLLETCGGNVVAVADGAAAREATALGARFDVLVCDVGLPGEDGCELLQTLRGYPNNPVPALALTAHVRGEDRERALAAGFDAFVEKPVTPADFIHAVAALPR